MTSLSQGVLSQESVLSLNPGTSVAGRFEIARLLGQGPSSAVYLCRKTSPASANERLVALKVLPVDRMRNPLALTRFDAEVSLSSRIEHPNVVRTFDTIINYRMLAYTMEYVSGGSLADYIKARGPLPINEVVSILKDVCAGLSAVHRQGVRHRDLKPANILLQSDLVAKISDFGISSDRQNDQQQQNGRIFGTAAYISPEVVNREPATEQSDIYSLGVTAYVMITGRLPFKGESTWETLSKRLHETPVPVRRLRRGCPEFLARIVEKAITRDPAERFPSADLMLLALKMVSTEPLRLARRVLVQENLPPLPRAESVNKEGEVIWN